MALGLAGKAIDDESDNEAADRRCDDLPPEGQPVYVFECVLTLTPEYPVQELDEESKSHSAQATQQPDNDGDQYHVNLLRLAQSVVEGVQVSDYGFEYGRGLVWSHRR
jgi:hypothetical protein